MLDAKQVVRVVLSKWMIYRSFCIRGDLVENRLSLDDLKWFNWIRHGSSLEYVPSVGQKWQVSWRSAPGVPLQMRVNSMSTVWDTAIFREESSLLGFFLSLFCLCAFICIIENVWTVGALDKSVVKTQEWHDPRWLFCFTRLQWNGICS